MAKLSEAARRLAHRLPAGRSAPASTAFKRTPGYVPAKAVGSFVPRLTRKAFEKYGFSTAALLTDWETIVGPALARVTQPERLKWPKGVEVWGEVQEDAVGRPGATLVLKVDPARALDIEYKRAQILDRINGFFGYRAVIDIRLVQHAVAAGPPPTAASGAAHARPAAHPAPQQVAPLEISRIADDGLRAALERMHAGVTGHRRPA